MKQLNFRHFLTGVYFWVKPKKINITSSTNTINFYEITKEFQQF